MQYLAWNDLLAAHFFQPDQAGRRVFLFATEDLIAQVGLPTGDGLEDFVEAIKNGPEWATRTGICRKAYDTFAGWRDRGLEYPPYIAYLCFFVIAAGHEGEFDPRSYYPRLRELLGETPSTGAYPFFDRMLELWDDLEQWSEEELAGELGIFLAYIQGRKIHIGVPLSQTFLTQQEVGELPIVFAKAGLDPAAGPSDQELLSAAYLHGQGHFRPPTIRLLDPAHRLNNDLRAALVDALRGELVDWDGSLASDSREESAALRHVALVLCCNNPDLVARRASFVFRCRSADPVPDDGLRLRISEDRESVAYCEPSATPWSTPLTDSAGAMVDATSFDWRAGFSFVDELRAWRCQLNGRPVHILVPAESQGLPGLVGVNRLPADQPFYLLLHESVQDAVVNWATENYRGFRDLKIRQGMPQGWAMYRAESASSTGTSPVSHAVLAPPLTTRLSLDGGLKVSRGNSYFRFAPPSIRVEGLPEEGDVYIEDVHVSHLVKEGELPIPDSLLKEGSSVVRVDFGGETIRRRFSLVSDFPWRSVTPDSTFDAFGNSLDANSNLPAVAGAFVDNFDVPEFSFNTLLEVAEHRRVFFVGRVPGQIVSWPADELPESWSPVWAVPIERRGLSVLCSQDISGADPEPSAGLGPRAEKRWKEVLWYWRRRVKPPTNPAIRSLWEKYQRAASNL